MELEWAYRQLAVNPGAQQPLVQSSYRRLARQWHPDLHQADPVRARAGAERLKHINAAYDAIRTAGFPPPPAPPRPSSSSCAAPVPPWSSPPWHTYQPPSPPPAAARPRPAPAPPAAQPPPRADDVSLLWALIWLALIILTAGALAALHDHDDA